VNHYKSNAKCAECFSTFKKNRSWQIFCSYKCGYSYRNRINRIVTKNTGHCARCAATLVGKRSDAIYCSKTCKSMDHNAKHRAKTRTTNVARRQHIFTRDIGICYLCSQPVDPKNFHIDHLIPVAMNGTNDESNLAVTHPYCNRSRGTRIEEKQLSKLKALRKEN
jgi:5-methylcytosine-specific restriction endonuclease McrA